MQYQKLDELILDRVAYLCQDKRGFNGLVHVVARSVLDECDRIARLTGRESFRIMDGRLQVLRKQGKIEYKSGIGWVLK